MKRNIKRSARRLAPMVLAAAALLAYSDAPTTRAETNTTECSAECYGIGSDFVPGSRHMPRC